MKNCTQCGKCCIAYSDGGLSASQSEIDDWENYHPEIYRYVFQGKIWINPDTKLAFKRCPFLVTLPSIAITSTAKPSTINQSKPTPEAPIKYGCQIYHNRPEDCRHYPVTIDQMIKDDCDMIEARDLKDFTKAQQALDKLMSDSRPPYL